MAKEKRLKRKRLKGAGSINSLTFHSTRTGAIKPRQPVNSDVSHQEESPCYE